MVLLTGSPADMTSVGGLCRISSLLQADDELYQRPFGPVRLQVSITGGQVTQASLRTDTER